MESCWHAACRTFCARSCVRQSFVHIWDLKIFNINTYREKQSTKRPVLLSGVSRIFALAR